MKYLVRQSIKYLLLIIWALTSVANFAVLAQDVDQNDKQINSPARVALKSAIKSGSKVELGSQASFVIPEGYLFIPKKQAIQLSQAMGNFHNEGLEGLVVSSDDSSKWLIFIDYEGSGYITDNDSEKLDADELLNTLKQSTDDDNKTRLEQGMGSLNVEEWIEKPNYIKSNHQLIWSIHAKEIISSDEQYDVVNYKASMLGREGKMSFVLVTDLKDTEKDKIHVQNILDNITFNEGKRYEDFIEGTDRVAGYGLAALITGVAAKKLGLLSVIGLFLIKIWKIFLVIPVLLATKVKSWFKKEQ